LAITTPPARSTYYDIEEIIDKPGSEEILNALIRLKAETLGVTGPIEICIDDKKNRIVTITVSGKAPKTIIWHPINIVVHEIDGTHQSISRSEPAYAVISYNTSTHRYLTSMNLSTLPNSIYLLSNTDYARTHFDELYRAHCVHTTPKTILGQLFGKKAESKAAPSTALTPGIHTTVSPLYLIANASRPKAASPEIDAAETMTTKSRLSLLSREPEHTRGLYSAASLWIGSLRQSKSDLPSDPPRWR
jgi:hypothetical protein